VDDLQASVLTRKEELARFIDTLVHELQPLQKRLNEAVWLANTTGESRHEEESGRLETEIRTLFSRREPYDRLRSIAGDGGVSDPHLQRQLTLLLHEYRAHQIPPAEIAAMVRLEKALESRFNNFRAALGGREVTDNELREILRSSDDENQRREAWQASKQIGVGIVPDLLELVARRNQAARDLGFDNYYSMMLELDELDETELFALLDDLESGTRPLFVAYKRELDERIGKRFGRPAADLAPWHYSDPFFQEAPAAELRLDRWFEGKPLEGIAERFFAALGFDIRDVLQRSDLFERPGKSQHAFCLSIDRGPDIRVLCNLRPNAHWMGTLLHEFGHAVYDQHIDPGLPYLLRVPAHILVTEASAMLFGRLSRNAAWLTNYAGVPHDEARATEAILARATRAQLLVQTRWCLVMCHMERALYRDPRQDLDTLWWDLVERYQLVRRPPGRRSPDWASKVHFSVAPVYYHNYMLGEMMASQLQAHILERVLHDGTDGWQRYVVSPAGGEFLRDRLYRSGKSMDWRDTIRHVTGSSLQPRAFVEELSAKT
jgi:peptidyl-dipeptidase A